MEAGFQDQVGDGDVHVCDETEAAWPARDALGDSDYVLNFPEQPEVRLRARESLSEVAASRRERMPAVWCAMVGAGGWAG